MRGEAIVHKYKDTPLLHPTPFSLAPTTMDDIDRIRRDHGLDLTTTDREALQALTSLKSNLSNSLRKYATRRCPELYVD